MGICGAFPLDRADRQENDCTPHCCFGRLGDCQEWEQALQPPMASVFKLRNSSVSSAFSHRGPVIVVGLHHMYEVCQILDDSLVQLLPDFDASASWIAKAA